MLRMFKRLPFFRSIFAVLFLLVQIACNLYLPYLTADIVKHGIANGDTVYVWQKGLIMLSVSVCAIVGSIFNTLIFSQLSYKLGGKLRSEIYKKGHEL